MTLRLRCVVAGCAVAACGRTEPPIVVKHHAVVGDLAITGATVIAMDREGKLADHTVLVRGDRIVAVASARDIDTGAATVIDARGKWLLPGLADMHVHLWNKQDLNLLLLNGVTTVRNMFGSPMQLQWRDAIARGELVGPTLVTAGPIVDGDPPTWPGSSVVTTPEAARAEVAKQKAAGYDLIKVYNGLSAEVYDAIVAEAKIQNIPVGGHVPKAVGIAKAIGSGQRSIEHLDGYVPFFGEPADQPLIEPTVKSGVWNCPTLVVTERFSRLDKPDEVAKSTRGLELVSPGVRAMWDPKNDFRLAKSGPEMFVKMRAKNELRRQLVRQLSTAGAKLVLGTDTGNPFVVPGFAVVDELALLVGAGLSPWQALRLATAAAGEFLGTPGQLGVVAAGARADLIVVDRDPLADIRNVADPTIVVVRGKVYRRDALLAAAKPAAPSGDRFGKLPALESEGTPVVAMRHDVLMGSKVIGVERAIVSRLDDHSLVVRGQAVYDSPSSMQLSYRSTRDALDVTSDSIDPPHVNASRKGAKVVATLDGKPPVALAAGADAVIAPQAIAEFVWYAQTLAELKLGAKRTLAAVEVSTETELRLEPGTMTFERKPDAAGRRVYSLVGKNGALDITGSMTVDADGAPNEVTLTVKFGTFVFRRT